eukprot:6552161-Prymnesium_polylepis.1
MRTRAWQRVPLRLPLDAIAPRVGSRPHRSLSRRAARSPTRPSGRKSRGCGHGCSAGGPSRRGSTASRAAAPSAPSRASCPGWRWAEGVGRRVSCGRGPWRVASASARAIAPACMRKRASGHLRVVHDH